jgi:hypothetical protein
MDFKAVLLQMGAAEVAAERRPTGVIPVMEHRRLVSEEAPRGRAQRAGLLKEMRLCIAVPAAHVRLSGIAIPGVAEELAIREE